MTEKKKRQPTLAGEAKKEVFARLKEHYPDFYKHFKLRTESWSTGGSVEVRWIDGPSRDEIKALLEPIRQHYSIISISPERDFTELFLTRIAREVCRKNGWELPKIDVAEDGRASITHFCLYFISSGINHVAYKTSSFVQEGNEP